MNPGKVGNRAGGMAVHKHKNINLRSQLLSNRPKSAWTSITKPSYLLFTNNNMQDSIYTRKYVFMCNNNNVHQTFAGNVNL